jgi:uncharacterized membrane protein YgcG
MRRRVAEVTEMNHRTAAPARNRSNRTLPLIVSGILALASLQAGAVEATPADSPATDVAAPLTPGQLDQLVAPIALYPDELVAEVLAASTYPTQVVEADRWMGVHARLTGSTLADAVNAQPWADSVKALAQFPSVLAMMDKNLSWTASLGGAYMQDSQSVMNAVQQMRARAQQAGNLKSTPQETVMSEGQTIVIEPADPDVVYVPDYDPWVIYGAPIGFYPDWVAVPGLFVDEPGIYFGFGIGIDLFGGFGWGWHHWAPDWHHHGVYFNHHPYISHDLTFDHHGPDAFARGSAFGHASGFGRVGGFGHVGAFDHGAGFGGGFHPGGFAVARGFAPGGARAGGFHGGGFHGGGFHGGGRR